MMTNEVSNRKWKKFLKRVRLFRFVPFVDFVLAAGSLATGKIHEQSDFDVIIGTRQNRMFTARFFANLFFEFFGWRRSKLDHKEFASDKICLNHFVTPRRYRLSPPYDAYWNHLYQNLVPVIGNENAISNFFRANDWLRPPRIYTRHSRYLGEGKSLAKSFFEWLFSHRLGNKLEKMLKDWQIKRIQSGLPHSLGYKPRFIYNDEELEFHPDTRRIEEMLAS